MRLWTVLLLCCTLITALPAQPDHFKELEFRNLGPNRGGRATTVAGVSQQPGVYYFGATGGGVWKTTDYGNRWQNVSDGFFRSPSIGAIRVAPANPEIVYVGTGSDGLRSNVIAGNGVYRSTNGGRDWVHLGLEATHHIGAVEVHPENPDVVFVAAIGNAFAPNPERGVYRTRNGGADWEQVLTLSDTIGFSDLELAPYRPDIIYAATWRAERKPWTIISGGREGGIYRSADGGDTWQAVFTGAELPSGLIGKIDLAVSPADPRRVYALIEAPQGEGGLFRSDDRGENWRRVSTKKELLDRPFYYCNVTANPRDANSVYVNATRFWHSTDGGVTWERRATPHGDNHQLWIHPRDTMHWVQCNDGGANVSLDGGRSWSTQANQPTAELYQVEVDDRTPYWLYAGQQDNTTIALPSLPPRFSPAGPMGFWEDVGGCETGPAVPKPGDPNIVYSNCKGRFGVYDRRTGQERQYYVGAGNMYGHNPADLPYRFQRVSPIHVSPHDPDVVYHASQFVHKTTDDGRTWETISPDLTAFEADKQVISGSPITRDITGEEFYSTIYALRESPREPGLIWVGANDGPVHVTRNGGKKWQDVTPADLPPGGRVDAVEPSPHEPGKAYIAVLRYQLGDEQPYIFKTEDYGRSWSRITNGLPDDFPVRVVREDPERPGLLYAGTEYGLFLSYDDGANWRPFQQNLPATPVTDIKVYQGDLILSTMGRGFWILDDLHPVRAAAAGALKATALLPPAEGVHFRYYGSYQSYFVTDRAVPSYPSPGVYLHYYLADSASAPLLLEIRDAEGRMVRAFTSEKGGNDSLKQRVPDMATGFVEYGFDSRLSAAAGLHRFRWDLRHAGSWHAEAAQRRRSGPVVAPGAYTVRLIVDGEALEQSLTVRPDPRLSEAGIDQSDLEAQEKLCLQIRDLLSDARRLAETLKDENSADAAAVDALQAELNTAEGRYRQPMLIDQIQYLFNMLNSADQRPGKDAYDRYDYLRQWYEDVAKRAEAVTGRPAQR